MPAPATASAASMPPLFVCIAIADAYLFTIVNWHRFLAFDIDRWPALQQFQARVAARPSVHRALGHEHLLKAA